MAWGPDRETARRRLAAALGEVRVGGLPSTAPYLRDVLRRPEFADGSYSTTTLEERWPPVPGRRPPADQGQDQDQEPPGSGRPGSGRPGSGRPGLAAGAARTVEIHASTGPFRIVIHGRPRADPARGRAGRAAGPGPGPRAPAAAGQPAAPMDGVVAKVGVAHGDEVERHAVLVVLEAMKMQIPVTAPWPGRVTALLVAEGDSVTAGQPLAEISRPPGE
jgi:acetyl-CoA/propionyl-CoA carboxylase biotin carboxyl carrier protein